MKLASVYIITNLNNTVLYIGVTSNLPQRIYQHKHKICKGFSEKYNLSKLVYFEQFSDMYNAIIREKRLKQWKRLWKERLINDLNPNWRDLYFDII